MREIGLLKKAQLLRKPAAPHLRGLGPDELRVEQDESITPEERQRVNSEIEDIVARSRLKVTPDTFSFEPQKNGGILPIIVNAIAVVVVAAGVLLAVQLSRRDERAIVSAPALCVNPGSFNHIPTTYASHHPPDQSDPSDPLHLSPPGYLRLRECCRSAAPRSS